jgi:Sigma-70, region 4
MASLDSLPADQRAVLQLVLQRDRSYDDIAKLLSIDRAAVRRRALSALDALGPPTSVPPERRALIADYLLGQLPPPLSDQVREQLAGSAGDRAWARVLASELAPLAAGPLPEIPGEGSGERPGHERPRSRLGGAILLAGGTLVAIAAVIVVVVIASNGSSAKHSSATTQTGAAATPTISSSTSTSTSAQVVAQINLNATDTHGKAAGIADVLEQGSITGIAIAAQGLAPNSKHPPNAYAVWLYNSASDSHILGFVNPGVGANGRLQAASPLPADAARYKQLIVTLETAAKPHGPGKIVLRGSLNLG